jgi:hypothetical protein
MQEESIAEKPASIARSVQTPPAQLSIFNGTESHYFNEHELPSHVTRIVPYGDQVILDSGATDHMHKNISDLSLVCNCYQVVLLADNHPVHVNEEGCLIIQVFNLKRGQNVFIPLGETLVVPGLYATLWSVTKFSENGHKISFEHAGKVATIRKTNRGQRQASLASVPGEAFFLDIVYNPSHQGLTPGTHYRNYLLMADAYSRFTILLGLNSKSTASVIDALQFFARNYRPTAKYTIKDDLKTLHFDAGSEFTSGEFDDYMKANNIAKRTAGTEHQEMNGCCE